ncbi:MAG: helix-turn-helix domain-containing protein [Candidatus Dormibacteraceae bacterium]
MEIRHKTDWGHPILLRVEEVAKMLGIARSTVYALISAGDLPVVRIGRVTRVSHSALEGWINDHTEPYGRRVA